MNEKGLDTSDGRSPRRRLEPTMLETRALHDGFGDDSGALRGASRISPSFKALSLSLP